MLFTAVPRYAHNGYRPRFHEKSCFFFRFHTSFARQANPLLYLSSASAYTYSFSSSPKFVKDAARFWQHPDFMALLYLFLSSLSFQKEGQSEAFSIIKIGSFFPSQSSRAPPFRHIPGCSSGCTRPDKIFVYQ